MGGVWHFRDFRPGDNASDPDFAKALFSKGSDGVLPRAIVRESVQNSLDARQSVDGTAHVRFRVRTGRNSAPASAAQSFFTGFWEHIHAQNSGLIDPPSKTTSIPFLVVEDFGTTGLIGDVAQWAPFGSERNAFFLFFRALGRSGKEGEDRGRWGVGKFVFPLASAASCWFGYSVTGGAGTAKLMGRVVLKTHGTAQRSYHPDGHWGLKQDGSGLVMPETDQRVLADFRALFSLSRGSETGLSVVVPWVSEEVSASSLILAAASEYFLPILRDELVITVDDNGHEQRIDSRSLAQIAESIDDEAVRERLVLAEDIATWSVDRLVALPSRIRYNAMELDDDAVSESLAGDSLTRLEAGAAIGIRVPVEIKPRNARPQPTHFDVFLRRSEGVGRQRPLIVREGITISEEKTTVLQGYTSLILVDDGPLAGLVGDAESPAHNELQYQLIKDKYTLAGKILQLLRTSPRQIIRQIERAAQADDPFLLAQFFPVLDPDDLANHGPRQPKPKSGPGAEPRREIPPPAPPRYRVSRVEGGFRVKGVDSGGVLPDEVTVRFAYDVRRGNPFKKYQTPDFSVIDGTVKWEVVNAEIADTNHNQIVLRPLAPTFECVVVGFDPNRNVIVRVDAR